MSRITAAEANQIIQQEQRQLNAAVLPPTLSRISRLMQEEAFSICNVGPWPYLIERGPMRVFIPAYVQKADTERIGYAKSDPMPEIRREARLTGGGGEGPLEYSYIEDDGRAVANDLIGIGFGLPPANALVQYGVFVPEGKAPTKAEISEAHRELGIYYDRLIADARDAYDKGPEERKAVISDRHLLAARVRGIDEKWVHHQHTQESVRCEMCGKYNPSGIAKCSCGSIIDFPLYKRLQEQQDRMLEEATRPKK